MQFVRETWKYNYLFTVLIIIIIHLNSFSEIFIG